ncbi:MAG: glycosyltransferase family 9 protein [Bryobacterales bacterium]|nr:glycosyltransferase family 9 protein [Bryobacterales bacterium]
MKRVLVLRLGAMGDIIHALPAVSSIRQSFPGASVCWLVERRWRPLVDGNPFVDEVLVLERGSFRGIARSIQSLRQRKFDLAIDFQGLLKSALAGVCGHPEKFYGYHASQVRERLAAFCYSHAIKVSSTHIVDRHLELAAAAGATARSRTFPIPPGSPEGDLPRGPFVLASPFAGWPSKQWPLEYYGDLAGRLAAIGLPLVWNVSLDQSRELRVPSGVQLHVSGIAGLIDATRRARAVVGVDSGPMHLAAALDKPGVALFGPTDPARNGPYGTTMRVLRSPGATTTYKRGEFIDDSMRSLSPQQVFEAVAEQVR